MSIQIEDLIKDELKNAYVIENGIFKFIPNTSYSEGNFSKLRDLYGEHQQDSKNGTTHRFETILKRTNWPTSKFKDKLILECGCGAGPDTEILLSLGAKVVSVDLTRLEVTKMNLGQNKNSLLVQASIDNLPFKKDLFDIVFCHRVIQHTPDPEKVLDHIMSFVKFKGDIFIHSYGYSFLQFFRWKYFLRPITKRLPSEALYFIIQKSSTFLFAITTLMIRLGKIGKAINYFFIPFENYSQNKHLKSKPKKWLIQYGTMVTFDYLSPTYDKPLSPSVMKKLSLKHLDNKGVKYEIIKNKDLTLLRSI